jgi:hypothetical protein
VQGAKRHGLENQKVKRAGKNLRLFAHGVSPNVIRRLSPLP